MRWFLLSALLLTGCSAMTYNPPVAPSAKALNSTVAQPRDPFLRAFVPALITETFKVNNVDKENGLIEVSYNGDPEKFLDCGEVIGELYGQPSQFPASRAKQTFQVIMTTFSVYTLKRELNLDATINVSVKAIDPQSTNVAVSTRYVLNRKSAMNVGDYEVLGRIDSVTFHDGEDGIFGKSFPDDSPPTCRTRGVLEKEILAIAERAAKPK